MGSFERGYTLMTLPIVAAILVAAIVKNCSTNQQVRIVNKTLQMSLLLLVLSIVSSL